MKRKEFSWMVSLAALLLHQGFAMAADDTSRKDPVEDHRLSMPSAEQVNSIQALRMTGLEKFAAATFQSRSGPIPYRLYSPSDKFSAPLVIVLHGSGSIGSNNLGQMGIFAKSWGDPVIANRFPAYVVIPQLPSRSAEYEKNGEGDLHSVPGASFTSLLELIEHLSAVLPIDNTRVYVVGFSMGASTAMNLLLARPDWFTAAVAFSPVPPAVDEALRTTGKPVLLIHGTADLENPYAIDLRWFRAVAPAWKQIRMIAIDGMAHDLPQEMILGIDWRSWLFSQRRESPMPQAQR